MEVASEAHPKRPPDAPPAALAIDGLSKSFGSNRVLSSVSLTVEPGQVHVLVGENGSGKSTLIKVLSGYHPPDPGGSVRVGGEELREVSSARVRRAGCRFVHQDLGLVADLTVLDNMLLGAGFPTRFGTVRRAEAEAKARASLDRLGLSVGVRQRVRELGAAARTGVAIARALQPDPEWPARLLVLDEPTATLPSDEVDELLSAVHAAAGQGVGVLFVTHHLEEVFRVGDVVTVLRDGVVVGHSEVTGLDRSYLVELLIGRSLETLHQQADVPESHADRPCLTVRAVHGAGLRGVSIDARPGEVVGVAGLTGSGRETLLGALFGAGAREGGDVAVAGGVIPPNRPDQAMRGGIGFLPSDRKAAGGVMALTAQENLTLGDLGAFWTRLRLNHRAERAEAARWFERLDVRPRDGIRLPLATFSGGNQQKILFAKWLRRKPVVLLLDEPTQGVDIGAKTEIHRQLLALAASGTAVIVSSTDLEELAALASRVLVMQEGRITTELSGDALNPHGIAAACVAGAGELVGQEGS
jgi:ribose transport system ATP-binding protein